MPTEVAVGRFRSIILVAFAVGLVGLLALVRAPAPELSLPSAATDDEPAAERAYGQLPLAFERDAGRQGPQVDFLSRTPAGTAFVGAGGATLALADDEDTEAIRLALIGERASEPVARERLGGKVSYLLGNRPSAQRTGIATFARVHYPDVYPGIALDWHGDRRQLEYDFRVAAGADPDEIALRLRGAEALRLAPDGDLLIDAGEATFRQRAPVAYQTIARDRRPVEAAFALDGGRVGFELGAYDRSRPLVIDPLVLAYSTYLGGGDLDAGSDIAVDANGSAYVAGRTQSTDFDTVDEIEGDGDGLFDDAFIAKLTPAGNALVYSTYLGGGASDFARGIAVDSSGAAYVTGATESPDFDTVNPIEGDSPGEDAFIAKLTPAGDALAYSTYLGGGDRDQGSRIAVDPSGAAYVTGVTFSTDFNTLSPIEGDDGGSDAFVAKLTPAGSALAYSTYLGGASIDEGGGIAVDQSGAAYLTGTTFGGFPTVNPIDDPGGFADAFVSKLTPAGTALVYSTYLGGTGSGVDFGTGIAVDSTGAAYVTGGAQSGDFPTVNPIEGYSGSTDVFISKLTPAGDGLAYSTFLGSSDDDQGRDIAVDATGAAYLVGTTHSTDFDTVEAIDGDSALQDVFISKLTAAGDALAYSTYLGGDGQDSGAGIAIDSAGAAYVTGQTESTDFNVANPIEGDSPGWDAFIAKVDAAGAPPPAPTTIRDCLGGGWRDYGFTSRTQCIRFVVLTWACRVLASHGHEPAFCPPALPGGGAAGRSTR
jgi:Beta-propeller repeat